MADRHRRRPQLLHVDDDETMLTQAVGLSLLALAVGALLAYLA